MSFLAKLFLDDTEHSILNADILFRQSIDRIQKPNGDPQGGLINIILQSTRDEVFLAWMLAPEKMKNGYIRFYKRDSMSKLADLEFWDCFCVNYYEYFAENTPLTLRLVLSPGVTRFHDVVFEKHWKITDLSAVAKPSVISKNTDDEKRVVKYFITDNNQNELQEYKSGDKIVLNIKTKNLIGEKLDVFLDDKTHDFKYKGNVLKNDSLKGFIISDDLEKIEIEVIDQLS